MNNKTDRGYKLPKGEFLEDDLPRLKETLQMINNEQNWQDKEIKRRKRREFIERVYGGQIWLKK